MGRKNELVVGALLYLIGAFIEALSARPNWNAETGIAVLIFGRVVYGCGIGFAMHGISFFPLSLSLSHCIFILSLLHNNKNNNKIN